MIEMESMAIAMPEVKGHPNRVEFQGVLTVVDLPSHQPPSGSNGHLVILSSLAAEAALPSLLGMALDYSPSFDRHDVRRKVGVITEAEIVGTKVEVGGYLFAHDFPEIVEEIACGANGVSVSRVAANSMVMNGGVLAAADRGGPNRYSGNGGGKHSLAAIAQEARTVAAGLRALCGGRVRILSEVDAPAQLDALRSKGELGMSYEVTDVEVVDTQATVWTLKKVTFTGAAILRRNKAAYQNTWIELVPSTE